MLNRMNKILSIICGFFFISISLSAQIDQEFWFAPPDLTQGTQGEINGGAFRDRPIRVVISTLTDAAQVTILQPANLIGFPAIVVNLAANSTQTVNLTSFIDQIETRTPDSVMNTGILVRSTAPITAYYELGAANNKDIIALKGKNANGTLFFTPFQTFWENARTLGGSPYIPQPRSGFAIVATDDTTNVTITPSIEILNHPAGIPFTIQLNRGQTYYCEAIDYLGASKPGGTKIESDKPVAVTVKDDMIDLSPPPIGDEGGADLAADQLISVENCGFKHIVVRGDLANGLDKVIVCATEDSTEIFADGNPVAVDTLNAGEQYVYSFTSAAGFIRGSKPIYVLHISGVGDQIAGAIIPSLECTGSNQVGFNRLGSANFKLNITIKAGSEGNFTLNGNPNIITAADFQPVPGTNGEWVYCRKAFTTAEIPVNIGTLLQNFSDELFHMGLTYQAGASCNYGYFTNFSYLELGLNRQLCLGDTATLDAGPGKTSYLWSTGDTTQKITVFEPGIYYVEVLSGNECYATDTITVTNYQPPVTIQAARDTICEGSQLLLTVPGSYLFEWQDGSNDPFFIVSDSGQYYVTVTDFQGCRARDTIQIWTSPRPPSPIASISPFDSSITGDTLCAGEPIEMLLSSVSEADGYGWIGANNTIFSGQTLAFPNSIPQNSGTYLGFSVKDGCESFPDTLTILVNPTPDAYIGLADTVCDVSTITLDPGAGDNLTYEWQDGSNNQTLTATETGLYWVEVSNAFECSKRDSVELFFSASPADANLSTNGQLIDQLNGCIGDNLDFSVQSSEGTSYYWILNGDTTITDSDAFSLTLADTQQSGLLYAYYMGNGCPSVADSLVLDVNVSPEFQFLFSDSTICEGTSLLLDASIGAEISYLWQDESTDAQLTASASGIYWVELENQFNCIVRDSVEVTLISLPQNPVISGDASICENQQLVLFSNEEEGVTYVWVTPNGNVPNDSLVLDNAESGTYYLIANVDRCINDNPDSVVVSINALPEFDLGEDQSLCGGNPLPLAGPDGMSSYFWTNGSVTQATEAGVGPISLTVADTNGCEFSDAIVLSQSLLAAAFASNPETGAQTGQQVAFTDQSTGVPISWTWSFGDNSGANTQNTSHAYAAEGELTVTLVVEDAQGCTDTLSRIFTVSNAVKAPNSFTPNSDGFNDFFVVAGLSAFPESALAVYNRWGDEVYVNTDYQNNWTGDVLPDGVYFYVLKLSGGEVLSGDVTIKR